MKGRIVLKPDSEVSAGGQRYRISQIVDLETVLAYELASGEVRQLKIVELEPIAPQDSAVPAPGAIELLTVSDRDWQIAQTRFEIIQSLLVNPQSTRTQASKLAQAAGIDIATLYRWVQRYQRSGRLAALIPFERSGGRGQSRLPPQVEAIIQATIEDVYLSAQKPCIQQVCVEVRRRCHNGALTLPHPNTVRRRIQQLSDKERLRRREGGKAAAEKYAPLYGTFPGADWPLAVVQIDHTRVDLILVDDIYRRAIGRPWITLAIDVFSRAVVGFYVSFDPPGAMAVGLCLAHAILPKEAWLAKHAVAVPWPIWGVMNVVHADNAKEFRGKMLREACKNYGIDLHWRPVARPHFGGHIERLLGTANHDIHTLPGTTFSTPKARGHYDAEKRATMTLSEFERWLTIYFIEVYHQRLHSELNTTPLQQFENGIFGNDHYPGRGLPDRLVDEPRLRLDLMPFQERTVQPFGVVIDEIHYYDDVLRPWINAADPTDAKRKRKFIIRRDPRDISVVYFYDPELKQYFEIPYRNTAHPPISVWELREAQRKLKEEGQKAVSEDRLFDAYNRLRVVEAEAVQETKKVRRAAQLRRQHADIKRPRLASQATSSDYPVAHPDEIEPFDEIEELDD